MPFLPFLDFLPMDFLPMDFFPMDFLPIDFLPIFFMLFMLFDEETEGATLGTPVGPGLGTKDVDG
jgi:hypothetical protein